MDFIQHSYILRMIFIEINVHFAIYIGINIYSDLMMKTHKMKTSLFSDRFTVFEVPSPDFIVLHQSHSDETIDCTSPAGLPARRLDRL